MLRLLLIIHIRNMNEDLQQLFAIRHFMQNYENDTDTILTLPAILFNIDHCRMPGFYDVWLDRYLNYDFFSLFRMSKSTFEKLLHKLRCEERNFSGGLFPPISTEKQLLITLWWLGKGEVLLSVADRFNVVVSTVHKATEFMLTRIINLQADYIVWPNMEESQTIQELFQDQGGYPGVVGAIDVCNVPFKAPLDQQESYIDRKMKHSIKLQAVVGPQKTFLYTNIGFPGSVHDSRVLRNSALFVEIEQNGNLNDYFYDENSHIVGDSAYPLRNWLMTPYSYF
ncbi:uncharacterized protein [Tenebrio molitor]|uniref:uncharacterized protein isoform X3 n=1 Tax=Tenebrio molitor TaxID=7067 RepID=UPI0036248764